jgi:hypothetical protein
MLALLPVTEILMKCRTLRPLRSAPNGIPHAFARDSQTAARELSHVPASGVHLDA